MKTQSLSFITIKAFCCRLVKYKTVRQYLSWSSSPYCKWKSMTLFHAIEFVESMEHDQITRAWLKPHRLCDSLIHFAKQTSIMQNSFVENPLSQEKRASDNCILFYFFHWKHIYSTTKRKCSKRVSKRVCKFCYLLISIPCTKSMVVSWNCCKTWLISKNS